MCWRWRGKDLKVLGEDEEDTGWNGCKNCPKMGKLNFISLKKKHLHKRSHSESDEDQLPQKISILSYSLY